MLLIDVKHNEFFTIASIDDARFTRYMHYMGIGVGDSIAVLRRAPFMGAFHVKNQHGAEFALSLEIARKIRVALPAVQK